MSPFSSLLNQQHKVVNRCWHVRNFPNLSTLIFPELEGILVLVLTLPLGLTEPCQKKSPPPPLNLLPQRADSALLCDEVSVQRYLSTEDFSPHFALP